MTEYIEITPISRLRVEPDDSPQCPRGDWHMLTGFVKIADRGDSRLMDVPAVHDAPIDIVDAYQRYQELPGWDWIERTERWARAFHGLVVEYDHEHGGFWFVAGADAATTQTEVDDYSRALFYDNWPELVPGSAEHLAKQAEVIEQEQETYRQWADGEVYGVILERSSLWAKLSADGSTILQGEGTVMETWEQADDGAIWGCYLDDEYTAQAVALEHFELTDDERAALSH